MNEKELGQLLADAATDDEAWAAVPVGIRACLAAVVLACEDQPVNGKTLAKAADFSRSTAVRKNGPWRDLVTALAQNPTALLSRLSGKVDRPIGPEASAEIAKRDATITDLRAELEDAKAALAPLRDYAHALAIELRQFRQDERDQLNANLRVLRSVGSSSELPN